ncbi:MAG: hypothetical protein LBK42_02055 [Propionibacteriaceae bacterium]|jgi:hypothetical protein|nr:hypothetical protein [Propionibacteriaceae bacterium]
MTSPERITLHICPVCGIAAFGRHDLCFPRHEFAARKPVVYTTAARTVALLEALRESWAGRPNEPHTEGALEALDQAITVLEEDG